MVRFYFPIFLLQIFCLYNAYNNKSENKWYWIIIVFPFFGSLFYLYQTFYNGQNIEPVSESVKHVVKNNYRIEKLEEQSKYSDTLSNRMLLAEEHSLNGNYQRSIDLYRLSLKGINKDDPMIIRMLAKNYFLIKDYKSVIALGNQILEDPLFKKSEEKIMYAWSLHYQGDSIPAEIIFKEMDINYSNYVHRLEYVKFLNINDRNPESKKKIIELKEELESMDDYEKELKKEIRNEINQYHKEID